MPRPRRLYLVALLAAACTSRPSQTAIHYREPAPPPGLRGTVTRADGQRVIGAVVAAVPVDRQAELQLVLTGPDGDFRFDLPAGRYAFTATSEHGTAAYQPPAEIDPAGTMSLALGPSADGFLVYGRVAARASLPVGVTVRAFRHGELSGDVFVTRTDHHGSYRLRLPRQDASGYHLDSDDTNFTVLPAGIDELRDQTLDLDVYEPQAVPAEAIGLVRERAVRLAGVEPGEPTGDLAGFGALIGEARLLGLGEATHGSHELFRLKHRLLEYLVRDKGFTGVVFEAGVAEARRVNDYVLHGKGSARAALTGLGYRAWDCEEVLALVEWMREHNRRHKQKVQFFGMDVELTGLAASQLATYLADVDAGSERPAALDLLARSTAVDEWLALGGEERHDLSRALEGVLGRLDVEQARFMASSGAPRWRQARENARSLVQWTTIHARDRVAGDLDVAARDRVMAENLAGLADELGPSARLAIWAGNGQVALERPPLTSFGQLLRRRYGTAYLAIGLVFAEGSFAARDGQTGERSTFSLGPTAETDWTTTFQRAGLGLALLDLRRLPAGPGRDWLSTPRPIRDLGLRSFDPAAADSLQVVPRRYDAVIFVSRITPTRANPAATGGSATEP
jgi:erythromycin esterase